ncbi:hypothetical protein E2562_017360 [Oryza meyeriana var. granulata]|uniref:Uncharacterized protein n=1 Tax=Oryza meyeriana var. granulata TaxID=110450 RepID=A0A6G1D4Z7_9ORYZ|nr:hypothetical protein E2562_017360 [Oryza meyeriana var. granulata]
MEVGFVQGAMEKLRNLDLSFKARETMDQCRDFDFGLENLSSLEHVQGVKTSGSTSAICRTRRSCRSSVAARAMDGEQEKALADHAGGVVELCSRNMLCRSPAAQGIIFGAFASYTLWYFGANFINSSQLVHDRTTANYYT